MVAALANVKPYLQSGDGTLAQMCQAALTFTMSVGLLEMAAESFQDAYYGPILVVCTTAQFAVGFIAVGFEWALSQFPEMFRKVGRHLSQQPCPLSPGSIKKVLPLLKYRGLVHGRCRRQLRIAGST